MKNITLLISLFFSANLFCQRVFYPVSSLSDYSSYRLQNIGFYKQTIRHENFRQFRNSSKPDTIIRIELIDENSKNFYDHFLINENINLNNKNRKNNCFKNFYKFYGMFVVTESDNHRIVINPIINTQIGKDNKINVLMYQNTRGAEVFGRIFNQTKGIGFYTMFTENQLVLPNFYQHIPDSFNFVPGEFYFKKVKNKPVVDFFQAKGYVTFNALNHVVNFKFGHDKHHIGNGFRSLILSDFAPQYLFFKINTELKNIHYQNLFTQFTHNSPLFGNTLFDKKFGAFHRLSFDLFNKSLQIGLNEMIIYDRIDSSRANQYDFNYLNPVIFYRAIETNLGSRDNSLLALDWHLNIRRKWIFYGQFLLDELSIRIAKKEPNWWGNKFGIQFGTRKFNFLTKNLDFLIEYNRVRPYTYSHYRVTQSYNHFNQALAHPLGANFEEMINEWRYVLKNKIYIKQLFIYQKQGIDTFINGRNYGSNLLRDNDSRITEYSSKQFMGKLQQNIILETQLSYMFGHNMWVDARLQYAKRANQILTFYQFGLRINAELKRFDW